MVFYIYKMKNINYIGSTNNIKNRTREHKYNCYSENSKMHNLPIYQYIREKQIEIELKILGVYKKECSKRIKFLVEQYYINEYNSVNNGLNTINAFGFDKKKYFKKYSKKYYEENKAKKKEYQKEYNQYNKEKIKEKRKEKKNIKINCPICDCLIRKQHLKRHQKTKKCLKIKNSNISQNEIDFKYNQTAYNEEGEFMNWY